MGQYVCLYSKKLNVRGKNADFFPSAMKSVKALKELLKEEEKKGTYFE